MESPNDNFIIYKIFFDSKYVNNLDQVPFILIEYKDGKKIHKFRNSNHLIIDNIENQIFYIDEAEVENFKLAKKIINPIEGVIMNIADLEGICSANKTIRNIYLSKIYNNN